MNVVTPTLVGSDVPTLSSPIAVLETLIADACDDPDAVLKVKTSPLFGTADDDPSISTNIPNDGTGLDVDHAEAWVVLEAKVADVHESSSDQS